jgi:hypothetical protein
LVRRGSPLFAQPWQIWLAVASAMAPQEQAA